MANTDNTYADREIDEKFDALSDKLGTKIDTGILHVSDRVATFERDTRESLSRQEMNQKEIFDQVKFTNGKVRKMIITLVLLGGIVIGQTFTNAHDIIQLLFGAHF
jgi:hypothetical protein